MSEPVIHALLIEDDTRLAALTRDFLVPHGVIVTMAEDGNEGLLAASRHRFDVVLLDLMLPGKGGLEVCQRLRLQSDVPIVMVTARGDEYDRVLGLEIGADDYLAKPFSPRELLARIRALVRRARGRAGPVDRPVAVGSLRLDPGSRGATLAGKDLDLTAHEFSLLFALAERAGRVLTREQLLELAHGSADDAFDRSVDVHISRLRQKLGDDPRRPRFIKTIRGAGYQLVMGAEPT